MLQGAPRRNGGKILADALRGQGIDTAFCVAGESYLELLDGLYDHRNAIRLITCRHEAGATNMAEAYGKLTGRPGVALVTRGPGACHGAVGVHTAYQDSTPMVLLIGQVGLQHLEREAFQEIDYRRMFGQMAKWVAQIDLAERIPEMLARAFHVATSGRMGPVVLALPEDMLREQAVVADRPVYTPTRAHPGSDALARLRQMLATAERPIMVVGGSGWSDAAAGDIARFAAANDLPTACSFRRQDVFDNEHSCFVGHLGTGPCPKLLARVREADLLLVVGARLGEITTQGYDLLDPSTPRQRLIHIHPSAEELGRVYCADLPIQSGVSEAAAALVALQPVTDRLSADWRQAARQDYLDDLVPDHKRAALDPGRLMTWLRNRLPEDAVITLDAGNFSGWPQRFLNYRRPGRQLGPTSGAMGYSVPAAIAASLTHPDRIVVSFVGDGGFMMTGQELATAKMYGATPIVLVFNNAMYGTIRMHQEREHPGRVMATALDNPDFAALARSFGLFGETVERTEDFEAAFEKALAAGTAAVIELRIDPELITTRTTLSAVREAATKAH